MTKRKTEQSVFFADEPDDGIMEVLGTIPGRWGRMSPLCRLLIFEIGCELGRLGIVKSPQKLIDTGKKSGLIGATKRGSLATDQAFIETMAEGPGLASPVLFGYTLPNIPLAEAAAAFGLTGPVYAVFDEKDPLARAEREARLLLEMQDELDFMIACSFDHYLEENGQDNFSVTLTVKD